MKAAVGDRIVVAAVNLGSPVRDGEILEVKGTDGGAPYLVRWSDSGRETLFFPGPDSHVESAEETEPADGSTGPVTASHDGGDGAASPADGSDRPPQPEHVGSWRVDVYIYEGDRATTAHAVLHSGARSHLDARGAARRSPDDLDVPEIGDEVAVARALRRLADRLLGAASDDIAALEGHPVELRF